MLKEKKVTSFFKILISRMQDQKKRFNMPRMELIQF